MRLLSNATKNYFLYLNWNPKHSVIFVVDKTVFKIYTVNAKIMYSLLERNVYICRFSIKRFPFLA